MIMDKEHLVGKTIEELQEVTARCGMPRYAAKQLAQWLYVHRVSTIDEMTNISKAHRMRLSEAYDVGYYPPKHAMQSVDGTAKYLYDVGATSGVEAVYIPDRERATLCVSSQVGCKMNCYFCMTGKQGFQRNLTTSEIINQILSVPHSEQLTNIVFMGMGEPMQNLDAIRKAIKILTHKDGRALSGRRITLSTCGVIKGIYDLADNGPLIRLAVSLTTANEDLRNQLMPINKGNPLSELRKAIDYYAKKTGKRVTLEAALLHQVNTSKESAKELINFAKNIDVNVNLIPWNPISTLPFTEPSNNEVRNFVKDLENAGINVTLRTKRGRSIGGACGQLGKNVNNSGAENEK